MDGGEKGGETPVISLSRIIGYNRMPDSHSKTLGCERSVNEDIDPF